MMEIIIITLTVLYSFIKLIFLKKTVLPKNTDEFLSSFDLYKIFPIRFFSRTRFFNKIVSHFLDSFFKKYDNILLKNIFIGIPTFFKLSVATLIILCYYNIENTFIEIYIAFIIVIHFYMYFCFYEIERYILFQYGYAYKHFDIYEIVNETDEHGVFTSSKISITDPKMVYFNFRYYHIKQKLKNIDLTEIQLKSNLLYFSYMLSKIQPLSLSIKKINTFITLYISLLLFVLYIFVYF